ncbi:MAG: hypothetical protein CMC15_13890 [Flavobacteriaceae bacterium]|nr:hypothetical protein [Flavobacteriaceae bacterium]
MGRTDRRVKIPGTNIKMKHHRAMCAVARYLSDGKMATTQEIIDRAKFRNGKAIITRMKSKQQLANLLRVHPHFDNMSGQGVFPSGEKKEMAHWFLCNKDSYLLGAGQAYPPEYYNQVLGQNKKGQIVKKEEGY